MARKRNTRFVLFALALLLVAGSTVPERASALTVWNAVGDPSFENVSSSPWTPEIQFQNGTVTVHDSANPYTGVHSARLSAVNRTMKCSSLECKDSVIASVSQVFQPSAPALNGLSNRGDSLSAWWYVATDQTLPTYSLHIGIDFTDGNGIEYFYGMSDLANRRYNLGAISTGSWFQMSRNLTADIQGVVAHPASTRVSKLWFGAFGGYNQSSIRGEVAWVDDVALNFKAGPVAVFSSNPAGGGAPLTVKFDATPSYEISGPSSSIVGYQWNFGDGSTGTGVMVTHTFAGSGTFNVTLVVTDSTGVASSSSTTVQVGPGDIAVPLILAGGGGILVAGLAFTRFRRRFSKERIVRQKFRKG